MKKVLVGYMIDGKHSGIDKYILNILEILSEHEIHFDVLTSKIDKDLKKYLRSYKSELYEIPRLSHPLSQYKAISNIIKENQYDIVYFNISEAFNMIGCLAAHRCKVDRVIVHSHSAGTDAANPIVRRIKNTLHTICKGLLHRTTNVHLACSKKAGEWLYPKRIVSSSSFEVINNAVKVDKFKFDSEIRSRVRKNLELDELFVVGHIGNFCYQKNNFFLVDIMKEVVKKIPNAVLLSIGDGPDYKKVCDYARESKIENHIKFLGVRNDVPSLLQAMDVFVLPSRFEGLPIVGIEAQVAGLTLVASNTISEEVKISNHCKFIGLNQSPEQWANEICKEYQKERKSLIQNSNQYLFDLREQEKQLESIITG